MTDRIRVARDDEGDWRWEFCSNGRTIAVSSEGYRDRRHCLHGLYLTTGVRVALPKGWRGTKAELYWSSTVFTPRRTTVDVWDSPWVRQRIKRPATS